MLRLTKSVCFALEMARSCLQTPYYSRHGLDRIWDDVTNIKVQGRVVTFRVRVRDFQRVVYVKCILALDRADQIDNGECFIEVKGNEPLSDVWFCTENPYVKFHCYNGYGLKWLGLDDDILATLESADILMFIELHELTEEQVWDIMYRESGSLNLTFDMLERLYTKLDAKNIKLEGPRKSREELAART